MISYTEHYATRRAAEAAERDTLERWHPCGYSTRTSITEQEDVFTLHVWRATSCD
jgi:hypothetical protein